MSVLESLRITEVPIIPVLKSLLLGIPESLSIPVLEALGIRGEPTIPVLGAPQLGAARVPIIPALIH